MPRLRLASKTLSLVAVLGAAAAVLAASPTSAFGGGGGGTPPPCAPLATTVKVVNRDGSGQSGIEVRATIQNCTSAGQTLQLTVSVPGSSTVPFKFSTGGATLQPGRSLTMMASPIGSTPNQLHYSQTYNVVATLTQTGATPKTLSSISTPVTMPPGLVT
jgi:hypothetical protein